MDESTWVPVLGWVPPEGELVEPIPWELDDERDEPELIPYLLN